ncbi:high affinity cationic amino acid transporter 1-like [Chroicocephalus ridibundus]|uniref:high affinity cationic amino acid transporter 1-like n=1 Tax=Chroicocephalus ridibundus TaxID=1192867 RepID=UPI002FDDBC92
MTYIGAVSEQLQKNWQIARQDKFKSTVSSSHRTQQNNLEQNLPILAGLPPAGRTATRLARSQTMSPGGDAAIKKGIYQPEQPNLAYQTARTTEETDNNESVSTSESQAGFLPEEEEKCSLKAILCPPNSDPSKFSGSVVNVSTFIIGFLIVGSCILTALEPSTLIKAVWIIAAILVLLVSFIIWKQPESKTKLSFKTADSEFNSGRAPHLRMVPEEIPT